MHSVQLFDFLSNNGSGVVVLIVTFVTRVGSLDCPVRPRSRPVITVNRDNIVNRMACVSCTSHSLVWLHLLSLLFLPVLTRKLPTRFSASFLPLLSSRLPVSKSRIKAHYPQSSAHSSVGFCSFLCSPTITCALTIQDDA